MRYLLALLSLLVTQNQSQLKFEFVKVPPGVFMMGCSENDKECDDDEKPARQLRITNAFEIGKYEVTQAMWESVMGTNPSTFKGADRPVEEVSWEDVQEFLKRLNQRRDGYRYRLPTEAEWEYAARAGSSQAYPVTPNRSGWYAENSERQTHPAGQKEPNAWGLHDTAGNVWEWVEDKYEPPPKPNREPPEEETRGLRGGSWDSDLWFMRVSVRYNGERDERTSYSGFRCVRQVVP